MGGIISDMQNALFIIKAFSFTLAFLSATIGTFKMYNKWQSGYYENTHVNLWTDMLLWMGGLVFFTLAGTFIHLFIA